MSWFFTYVLESAVRIALPHQVTTRQNIFWVQDNVENRKWLSPRFTDGVRGSDVRCNIKYTQDASAPHPLLSHVTAAPPPPVVVLIVPRYNRMLVRLFMFESAPAFASFRSYWSTSKGCMFFAFIFLPHVYAYKQQCCTRIKAFALAVPRIPVRLYQVPYGTR